MKLKQIWSYDDISVWCNEDGQFFKKVDGTFYQMHKHMYKYKDHPSFPFVAYQNKEIFKRFNCMKEIYRTYVGEIPKGYKLVIKDSNHPKKTSLDNIELVKIDYSRVGKK